jgi:predicted RecB family nuclease
MKMDQIPFLTKSSFLRGVQCQKSLALNTFSPGLKTPLSITAQFRLQQGQRVGEEARQRYPGGSFGRAGESFAISVDRTQKMVESRQPVIYEAAFEAEGVRIVVDVLTQGQAGWRLIEVKSSASAKPEYLWDVAVQLFVLNASGLEVEDAVLMHLNNAYVRQGSLDHQNLFLEQSLLEDITPLLPEVEQVIRRSQNTLSAGDIPDVPIGPYCTDPDECDFKTHCWGEVPIPSVFDVHYIGKKAYKLYDQGIEHIEDIPDEYALDKRSRFHIERHKGGQPVIDQPLIGAFLESLCYPLYYLDFETFAAAIPPFEGLSPYTKVPFQYSLHIQKRPGGALEHRGYLAPIGVDPRAEFLQRLLEDTQGEGSILVYYLPFERGVLKSLRDAFHNHQADIEAIIDRLVDLMDPFKQRAYWHPDMGGSNSLKVVMPVFASDLSYGSIEIGDGETAMVEFLGLTEEAVPERIEAVRSALWEYCHLDTLAMVRILDGLREFVKTGS